MHTGRDEVFLQGRTLIKSLSKAGAWMFSNMCNKIHFISWLIASAYTYILERVLISVHVDVNSKCFVPRQTEFFGCLYD